MEDGLLVAAVSCKQDCAKKHHERMIDSGSQSTACSPLFAPVYHRAENDYSFKCHLIQKTTESAETFDSYSFYLYLLISLSFHLFFKSLFLSSPSALRCLSLLSLSSAPQHAVEDCENARLEDILDHEIQALCKNNVDVLFLGSETEGGVF